MSIIISIIALPFVIVGICVLFTVGSIVLRIVQHVENKKQKENLYSDRWTEEELRYLRSRGL
jgi:hypothetical protein